MTRPIRSAAVLGAGVMGAGIAAHLANAGIPTVLLDIVPPNLTDAEKSKKDARNRFAAGGLEKALKSRPASFFHPSRARLVSVGNLEDDLDKLKDVDIVIEAVIERLDIKQALFAKLESVCKPGTIVASNTSGLPIAQMTEGRGQAFKQNFLVTHFFNPPRYMKLLELIAGPETTEEVKARVTHWGREMLGKGIVWGKDTTNFVGNRIGCHAMMAAIHEMLASGLTPEDVDAIVGEPMARPKSAAFRTADMVGLDTFVHVSDNCYAALTADEDRDVFKIPDFIRGMVEKKQLGDKTKGGFYKKTEAGLETLDYKTGQYRPKQTTKEVVAATKALKGVEDPRERLRRLIADKGPAGAFAWKVTAKALAYSARRIPEIADDIVAIDDAMKWGYNWELGPFEVWDALGFAATVERMQADGVALPAWILDMKAKSAPGFYKPDSAEIWDPAKGGYKKQEIDKRRLPLPAVRKGAAPVIKNQGAELWDLGDGIAGLTFKTKANSIDSDVINMLHEATEKAESDFRGMVIFNEGEHFCVGANLFAVVMAAQQKQWDGIRQMVTRLQAGVQRMKYASVPIVAAPYGMALGGGLEICLAANNIQAAAETYSGLVEVGVGLLPGGGGNLNLLWRAFEGIPEGAKVDAYAICTQVFMNIALAKVATSADEAKMLGYFRQTDGVSFDKERLLHDAKARAIGLAESGFTRAAPRAYTLPGENGIATFRMMVQTLVQGGQASEHDAKIAMKVATVLCGGIDGHLAPVSEEKMLELEAEAFLSLCGEAKSQERMQYMLMNNKPLRN
jgi:3-hydroxyacyl-CoA dehydrogenase